MADATIEEKIVGLVRAANIAAEVGTRRGRGAALPFVEWRRPERTEEQELAGRSGIQTATFEFRIIAENYDDLGVYGPRIRNALVDTVGALGVFDIKSITEVGDEDDDEDPNDGGQVLLSVRSLRFEVLYTE